MWASRAKVAVEPVAIHAMPMITEAAIKTMVRSNITHSSLIIMPSLPFGDFSFCGAHRLGSSRSRLVFCHDESDETSEIRAVGAVMPPALSACRR